MLYRESIWRGRNIPVLLTFSWAAFSIPNSLTVWTWTLPFAGHKSPPLQRLQLNSPLPAQEALWACNLANAGSFIPIKRKSKHVFYRNPPPPPMGPYALLQPSDWWEIKQMCSERCHAPLPFPAYHPQHPVTSTMHVSEHWSSGLVLASSPLGCTMPYLGCNGKW